VNETLNESENNNRRIRIDFCTKIKIF